LGGEKIDIVRWHESVEMLIMNGLRPAELESMLLDEDLKKATIFVPDDQLSLAIGRKGQNVRLASKLTGWSLDIVSAGEAAAEQARQLLGGGEVETGEAAAGSEGAAATVEAPTEEAPSEEALAAGRELLEGLAFTEEEIERLIEVLDSALGF